MPNAASMLVFPEAEPGGSQGTRLVSCGTDMGGSSAAIVALDFKWVSGHQIEV